MCEPTTLMAASIAATALSTGVGMYAQYENAQAQKKAAQYNAQAAENEAAAQQELAKNEMAKGIADKERQQRQAARAMGQARADMAASGFELDSGSNLSLLAESAAEHQYDSGVIMSNARQAAWQHELAALNATNRKDMADWQAANAMRGLPMGMAGTLLGGIGQGIGTYGGYARNNPAKPKTDYNGNRI